MSHTSPPPSLFDGFSDDEIDRCLAGKGAPDEAARFHQRLAQTPGAAEWIGAFKGASWLTNHDFSADLANGSAKAQIARRLGFFPENRVGSQAVEDQASVRDTRPVLGQRRHVVPRAIPARRWTAVGLGACVILVASTLLLRPKASATIAQRYQTGPGLRSTVQLPDGSTIVLAPATAVRVAAQNVEVTGEAYFIVAPRATRPFVVQTLNAAVQVLGTRFSVRHYADDASSRVVVEEGRVALHTLQAHHHHGEGQTIISARMVAMVADSGVTVTSGIALHDYTSWTQGTLVFNRMALRDIVAELTRAYGTDIQITDTTLARHVVQIQVSVTEDPLSQVLEALCKVTNAHFSRSGQSFVLSPGRTGVPSTVPPTRVGPTRHLFSQLESQYGR